MAQIPVIPSITDLANGGSYFQAPIGTPRQQELQNQAGELAIQRLANPTQGFDPIATNARNEFYTETVPGLAERFTSLGGGQRSSGFQRALGRAGSNLSSNLAAQGAQYGLQQQGLANQQLNTALQPQYSQAYYQPQDNVFGAQLGAAAGDLANAYFKAPGGNALEKAKSVLGLASNAGEAIKGVTQGASQATIAPDSVTAQAATGVGQTLTQLAAPAVGSGLATGASKLAATNPALASTIASKATGTAAAGTAAKAATSGLGWEAAIAPALAAGGAIAMPIAVAGLFGWWLYKLIND